MTTVLLSWEDPEDARQFLQLREELLRQRYLFDPSAAALLDIIAKSEVEHDG